MLICSICLLVLRPGQSCRETLKPRALEQGNRVSEWVKHAVGLPQYVETFRKNSITVICPLCLCLTAVTAVLQTWICLDRGSKLSQATLAAACRLDLLHLHVEQFASSTTSHCYQVEWAECLSCCSLWTFQLWSAMMDRPWRMILGCALLPSLAMFIIAMLACPTVAAASEQQPKCMDDR